ncbi:MAG: SDR family oxidoreductase [Anaerolineae bacterium]|nr:SDR family oxidoreductase [Anaerolineae bacterium]
MKSNHENVILVTGASSGIGAACVEYLSQQGHRVFGAGRRAPFPPVPDPAGAPVLVHMDVDDAASVQRAVDVVVETAGRIDAVVNNAGFGTAGAVEETSVEVAQAQFNTNFFGVLRVCHAVLPIMRAQGRGTIVNIGSLGGVVALPFQPFYSASKFALRAMTDALRVEVKPFGIHVVLVEPGDVATSFTANRRVVHVNPVYAGRFERMMTVVERDECGGAAPQDVARVVARAVAHPSPQPCYRVGPPAQQLAAALKGVLPARLVEWALIKYYNLE